MSSYQKRSQQEIERDYKRCQAFMAGNTTITTIRELAEALNLTPAQVVSSYSRHHINYRRLQEQLNINRQHVKVVARITPLSTPAFEKPVETATPSCVDNTPVYSGYVLDASVTECPDIVSNLGRICYAKGTITLTSVTIRELDNLKKGNDSAARDARSIMRMALNDPAHFKCVAIDENGEPDDCIIRYCEANKDKVTLLTADNAMTLKARMYGISVHHFEHKETALTSAGKEHFSSSANQFKTLYDTTVIDGKLYLLQFEKPDKSIRVISDGIEYVNGPRELKRGDDIYIIKKYPNYVCFSHLRLANLQHKNNSVSVFSKRIYSKDAINEVPCAGYKSFLRDFVKRENLF